MHAGAILYLYPDTKPDAAILEPNNRQIKHNLYNTTIIYFYLRISIKILYVISLIFHNKKDIFEISFLHLNGIRLSYVYINDNNVFFHLPFLVLCLWEKKNLCGFVRNSILSYLKLEKFSR